MSGESATVSKTFLWTNIYEQQSQVSCEKAAFEKDDFESAEIHQMQTFIPSAKGWDKRRELNSYSLE